MADLLGGLVSSLPGANILADIAGFANPFGASAKGKWNLTRMLYTNKVTNKQVVLFTPDKDANPASKTGLGTATDRGGRRLAEFNYPYRDGRRFADLGRKGEDFDFDLVFWGLNYQDQLNQFITVVLNNPGQGVLAHPVRGTYTVKLDNYEFIHKYDMWSAVTVRCEFKEDNTDALANTNTQAASSDSALRSALQTLTDVQSSISTALTEVSALLSLPNAIKNSLNQRLASITGQISRLLGQFAATFSSNNTLQQVAAQAAAISGGVTSLNLGTVKSTTTGSVQLAQLPPVFQVGFDATTQAAIQTQVSAFVNSNQITPQQAVYLTNQARAQISTAIAEVNTNLGNDGYDIMVLYRGLAVTIQQAAQAAIASAQALVTVYTVPSPMSLRMVAFLNGLTPDNQNAIEALNPYLGSVNYIPAGTQLTVPIA